MLFTLDTSSKTSLYLLKIRKKNSFMAEKILIENCYSLIEELVSKEYCKEMINYRRMQSQHIKEDANLIFPKLDYIMFFYLKNKFNIF